MERLLKAAVEVERDESGGQGKGEHGSRVTERIARGPDDIGSGGAEFGGIGGAGGIEIGATVGGFGRGWGVVFRRRLDLTEGQPNQGGDNQGKRGDPGDRLLAEWPGWDRRVGR